MGVGFDGSQKTKYVLGKLVLTAGQTKALTDATFEDANGSVTDAPAGLRGWLLYVSPGDALLLVRNGGTIEMPLPAGAFSSPTASDLTGLHAKGGASGATVYLIAPIGGVS